MRRDFHAHRRDLTARGLAGYLACPKCSGREAVVVTAVTAHALERLLNSIQKGGTQ